MQKTKTAIAPLILALFLDYTGLLLVLPIYTPLLLDPNNGLLPSTASHGIRTTVIGLLIATYGIAQFFAGPILGEISDQLGRRRVIIAAMLLATIGYLLAGFSLVIDSLSLLFCSRFIIGFASGTWAVLAAAITDISDEESRGKNLGYLTGGACAGFIVGPLLGSRLSDANWVSWFNWSTPFWLVALLFLLSLIWILATFHDTKSVTKSAKIYVAQGFRNIYQALHTPSLVLLFLVYFFYVLSTESYFVSLPIFVVQKFHASSNWIGNAFAIAGITATLTTFYFNKYVTNYFSSRTIYATVSLLMALLFFALIIPSKLNSLYIIVALLGFLGGFAWTHSIAVIAQTASPDEQGKIMGITQSLLAVAIIFGPLTVGVFAAVHYNLALLISGFSVFLSWLIFCRFLITLRRHSA